MKKFLVSSLLAVVAVVMVVSSIVAQTEEYKEGQSFFDPESGITFFVRGIEGIREKEIRVSTLVLDEKKGIAAPIPFNELGEDIREIIKKLVTYNRNKGFTVKEVIMLLPSSQPFIPLLQNV